MVEEVDLMEAAKIGEGSFYRFLMEIASPSIGLIRTGIVQQNTDRGRQDHFHFFGWKSGLF